jgi:hypothetical protein
MSEKEEFVIEATAVESEEKEKREEEEMEEKLEKIHFEMEIFVLPDISKRGTERG